MGEIKTKKTTASVTEFIEGVSHEQRRKDAFELLKILKQITRLEPALWGTSIIGFGEYHYKSERSSQEGDWPLIGFSPRKQNLSIYIMPGFADYELLLNDLGKHKKSVGCLYINKLDDVDTTVLKKLLKRSFHDMKKKYH